MERYLVTGGAGFIGSHLVETLLDHGHFVRVLDNFDTGNPQNLPQKPNLEVIKGSVTNREQVRSAMKGIDYVLHQAARASVPRSISDPIGTHQTNDTGTLYVLLAAKETGVKRVIGASSSAIYGEDPTLPKEENMLPAPLSPYAVSKMALEQYASAFHTAYKLPTVCLRYFNIYGPRQNPDLQYAAVIPIFIRNMLRNHPCSIYGDGEQTRDFVFVADCVRANLLACKAEATGRVYNIARSEQTSVNQLFTLLSEIIGFRIPPVREPARAGDIKHSYADGRRAAQELGFRPQIDLREGLKKTVEWYSTKLKA
jgi:nucleoside-diphosphate-sugar epimerase